MKNFTTTLFLLLFAASSNLVFGQTVDQQPIKEYLLKNTKGLSATDLSDLEVTDAVESRQNGATFVYLSQRVNGLRISNSSLTALFSKDGTLLSVMEKFERNISERANNPDAEVDLTDAVSSQLGNVIPGLTITSNPGAFKNLAISGSGFNHLTRADLVYYAVNNGPVLLAWSFDCPLPDGSHWYNYKVDAHSGELIHKVDWQVECTPGTTHPSENSARKNISAMNLLSPNDGSGYRVFEFPVESPNHGSRTLAVEPANALASPYGWHDTDGADGAEYTITRGNNVYAYEDVQDANEPGLSPDGGSQLLFDFPYQPNTDPDSYQSAAITNLFYANNRIHDLLYQYGFDEASGNFQETNYTGQGIDDDVVFAESQDGGGSNNANFSSPPDGYNPRMQMYLWSTGSDTELLHVNSPSTLEGDYFSSGTAGFGPGIPLEGITADLAVATDGVNPDVNDGCESVNVDLTGKIAILMRGNCTFVDKVLNAQEAGALACIVVNNQGNNVIEMGGTGMGISIPSLMIGQTDGEALISELTGGEVINATLSGENPNLIQDGSFDNGVITHEYCHGLSIRLTGGSSNSDCLSNDEQMGEGWSDWYALMFTMNMDVDDPVRRPMGTFASGDPVDGIGIRPAPYDTSFAVNDYTYADLGNSEISIPHGVGFIWSTMLWDLTWAFIDAYGYDSNIDSGTGGNNMLLQIVTDALKIQGCSPGFVDARDAILYADQINNDGANKCLIWKVFAKRGLGFSADQGSSQSRSDGTAAFDIPVTCIPSTAPPVAAFTASVTESCDGLIQFTDESENNPQYWNWNFGDGTTSSAQNPSHTYQNEGVYTVSLEVTNELGNDVSVQNNLISFTLPEPPATTGASGCTGDLVSLTASSPEGDIRWTDSDDNLVGTGNTLEVEVGEESEIYFARTAQSNGEPTHIGPADNTIGEGGMHTSGFIGTIVFETYTPLEIQTAEVYSGGPGQRVVNLWQGPSASGVLIDQRVVDINFTGAGTIDLGFTFDEPGVYTMGLNNANLYRNTDGTDYPYTAPGLMSITGGSAGSNYYYFFYNMVINPRPCLSEPVETTVEWTGSSVFTYDANETDFVVHFISQAVDATSWDWDFGDGNTSDEENPTHTYAASGSYTVSLTTDTGCSYSEEILVGTSAVTEVNPFGFAIQPNPARESFSITADASVTSAGLHLNLYDIEGRLVYSDDFADPSGITISIGNLEAGVYMVVIDQANEPIHRQRLVIIK